MKLEFCNLCGGKLQPNEEFFECTSCGQKHYLNPKPCVALALFNTKGEILLSKRAHQPNKGRYDLPGGFIDTEDKTLEMALRREINEELSIDWEDIKDVNYVTSYVSNYPWGKDIYKNLIMVFVGATEVINIESKDDVEEVTWFNPASIETIILSEPELKKAIDKLVEYNKKKG